MEDILIVFGGDACCRALGKRLSGILRCDSGDMMCTYIVLGKIIMLGGCL